MTVAPICAGMSSVYDGKVTALIVAGASSAALDPLAERAGVSDRYLVPVDGMPMIERLVMNAAMSPRIGAIRIAAREADEIAAIPSIAKLVDTGRLAFTSEAFDMVDSMSAGADGASYPILITTPDNCLWLPQDFTEFADKAIASKAAAAAAIAREEDVIAVDPVTVHIRAATPTGSPMSAHFPWRRSCAAAESLRRIPAAFPKRRSATASNSLRS